MNRKILSALIGLTGAISNNGKTDQTDKILCEALIFAHQEEQVQKLHQEKFRISPDCETCQNPCGNTSDYPLEKFDQWTVEQRQLKEQIIEELQRIASDKREIVDEMEGLPEGVYKAIAYLGYDLQEEAYIKLLEEMKTW